MGQKVSPTGIRLGIATDWASKWYASSKNFPDLLETDLNVRQFLKKYPNLYFDIVQGGPGSIFPPTGAHEAILYEAGGGSPRLKGSWLQLFNVFPDRFVLGSDVNPGRWEGYDKVMSRFRAAVLSALAPATAEKIAFKNAWRLMSGENWT